MGLIDLIRRYRAPSVTTDTNELHTLDKVVECVKLFIKTRFVDWIHSRSEVPIMMFYSSDTTPLSTKERWSISHGDLKVTRYGKQCTEWLCHRCFLQDLAGHTQVMLGEPLPMGSKDAWAHFSALRQFVQLPRQLGHNSICVHHYVWDRAVYSALDRYERAYHTVFLLNMRRKKPTPETKLADLMSWYTAEACKNHDAHNGMKASIMAWLTDKDVAKGAFVAIESLRRGYDALVKGLPGWLNESVVFEDWDFGKVSEMWEILGVDAEWAQELETLQLRFEAPYLKVAKVFQAHKKVVLHRRLEMVLLHMFQFRRFSESRWCSLGSSARTLVGAIVVGLQGLHDHLMQRADISKYFIRGFGHFSGEVRKFFAVVATSSHGVDAVLTHLLTDDRLVRVFPEIRAALVGQLMRQQSVGAEVWAKLGSFMGMSGDSLRHESLNAGLVAAAFTLGRFRAVQELPWTLCAADDYDDALRDLAEQDQPAEETTAKIWCLMKLGIDTRLIKDGLLLLRNTSWSSTGTEQTHVSAAMYMKQHKEASEQSMIARSFIIQVGHLVEDSADERRRRRLKQTIERLDLRRPECITGRQVFLQGLLTQAQAWRKNGRVTDKDIGKKVVATHGARWKLLTTVHKTSFEKKAMRARAERRAELFEKKAKVAAELLQVEQKLQAEAAAGPPVARLSAARWDEAAQFAIDKLFDNCPFSREEIDRRRAQARVRVVQPSESVRDRLTALAPTPKHDGEKAPAWLRTVCYNRHFFRDCIVRFSDGQDGVEYSKVVYCVQNPLVVCFGRIERIPDPPAHEVNEFWSTSTFRHAFLLDVGNFMWTDECSIHPEWQIDVLTDVVMKGDRLLGTHAIWRPMLEVCGWFGPCDAEDEDPEPMQRPPNASKASDEMPWLLDDIDFDEQASSGSVASKARVAGPGELIGFYKDVSADEMLDAFHERRAEVAASAPPILRDFVWVVRGGAWTAHHTGLAFDSFRGEVRGGDARRFCALFGLQASATFAIRAHSEALAQELALEWCLRRQHWFDIWDVAGRAAHFSFSAEDIRSYAERPVFVEALRSACPATMERAAQMRAEVPRRAAR